MMTLPEAVTTYVKQRRALGAPFVDSERILHSLCRHAGNIELDQLTAAKVTRFLEKTNIAPITRAGRFSVIKCFVEHYVTRGTIPSIHLAKPPKVRDLRAPFVYSVEQVRDLIAATRRCQSRSAEDKEGKTLCMSLILLYATGATVDEVLSLRVSDVNLRKHVINFQPTVSRHGRKVPIHPSLSASVASYLESVPYVVEQERTLLRMVDGKPLRRQNLSARFRRLSSFVGIKQGPNGHRPYLHDLRYSFAVHRLKRCIEAKQDLNILIPLLSAYMGYTSLMEAERFLAFTPERFRNDLEKLSPSLKGGPWVIGVEIIAFLDAV